MKLGRFGRKSALTMIIGAVIVMLIAPSGSSFFSTANPPPPGHRGPWPGAQGNIDVSASVSQIDDNPANIFIQAFTGGPINNPQFIGPPPGGQDWVWVVEYDLTAQFMAPANPNVDMVEAAVEAELNLIRGGAAPWACTEGQRIYADAATPQNSDSGWLYLYDQNQNHRPLYQQGDVYHLYVYAQGRYHDSGTNTWNTTAFQSISLYYSI